MSGWDSSMSILCSQDAGALGLPSHAPLHTHCAISKTCSRLCWDTRVIYSRDGPLNYLTNHGHKWQFICTWHHRKTFHLGTEDMTLIVQGCIWTPHLYCVLGYNIWRTWFSFILCDHHREWNTKWNPPMKSQDKSSAKWTITSFSEYSVLISYSVNDIDFRCLDVQKKQ